MSVGGHSKRGLFERNEAQQNAVEEASASALRPHFAALRTPAAVTNTQARRRLPEKRMTKNRPQALIITGPGTLQKGLSALMTAIPRVNVISEVADGFQALEAIRRYRPSLVLLDTNLPGDEGWQVLKQIRSQWPKIRCIVLADDVQQQRRAEVLGADVVLLKGFPPAKLAATIEKLLL